MAACGRVIRFLPRRVDEPHKSRLPGLSTRRLKFVAYELSQRVLCHGCRTHAVSSRGQEVWASFLSAAFIRVASRVAKCTPHQGCECKLQERRLLNSLREFL